VHGKDRERLAHVHLVHPEDFFAKSEAIIALDHHGKLPAKAFDAGTGRRHPKGARKGKTGMLILGMAIEMAEGRFQDMGRGQAARGDAPAAILEQQSGLGLRPGQAELAGVARQAPCRMVFTQEPQPVSDLSFLKPIDPVGPAACYESLTEIYT